MSGIASDFGIARTPMLRADASAGIGMASRKVLEKLDTFILKLYGSSNVWQINGLPYARKRANTTSPICRQSIKIKPPC